MLRRAIRLAVLAAALVVLSTVPQDVAGQETCYLDITCDGWCPFNQEFELTMWICCTNGTCVPPVHSHSCC